MNTLQDTDAVTVGIDAAVTANHQVIVRRPEPGGVGTIVDDFAVPPTLDGLGRLRERLAAREVRLAVAEPTSMTWLGLSIALREAGIDLALLGSRHVARLRGALSGKSKSDVIDAQREKKSKILVSTSADAGVGQSEPKTTTKPTTDLEAYIGPTSEGPHSDTRSGEGVPSCAFQLTHVPRC